MSLFPIGKRVAVVSGPHFDRAGSVAKQPEGYPQTYVVRLDGGREIRVAPNEIAAVTP